MDGLLRPTLNDKLRGLSTLIIMLSFFGNLMIPDKHHSHPYWFWLTLANATVLVFCYILRRFAPKSIRVC